MTDFLISVEILTPQVISCENTHSVWLSARWDAEYVGLNELLNGCNHKFQFGICFQFLNDLLNVDQKTSSQNGIIVKSILAKHNSEFELLFKSKLAGHSIIKKLQAESKSDLKAVQLSKIQKFDLTQNLSYNHI